MTSRQTDGPALCQWQGHRIVAKMWVFDTHDTRQLEGAQTLQRPPETVTGKDWSRTEIELGIWRGLGPPQCQSMRLFNVNRAERWCATFAKRTEHHSPVCARLAGALGAPLVKHAQHFRLTDPSFC